jgi:cation diffusion facilitator CzcD-associated flavoprotein CzcO
MRLFARLPAAERVGRIVTSAITEFILIFMLVNYKRVPWPPRLLELRLKLFLRRQVKDPGVRRKLTPDYGFGCKRPSVSNSYLRTFNRDNVELVTDPIDTVTPTGLRTADGTEREVDAIVLATGFRLASDPENYRRTPVRGRDGFDLATHYTEHRLKAYEGISMPGLPNHFMIFGPYGWTGAAWHVLVETASRHITRVIREARRRNATEVEVRADAVERFHRFVERRLAGSLWLNSNCAGANSYYFDHHGDVPYLRPTSGLQAHRASRNFSLEDYRFATVGASPTAGATETPQAARTG